MAKSLKYINLEPGESADDSESFGDSKEFHSKEFEVCTDYQPNSHNKAKVLFNRDAKIRNRYTVIIMDKHFKTLETFKLKKGQSCEIELKCGDYHVYITRRSRYYKGKIAGIWSGVAVASLFTFFILVPLWIFVGALSTKSINDDKQHKIINLHLKEPHDTQNIHIEYDPENTFEIKRNGDIINF